MKTIQAIKSEIQSAKKVVKSLDAVIDKRQIKRITKNVSVLNQCVFYLETKPSEVFIYKQLESVEKKIALLDKGFDAWMSYSDVLAIKKKRQVYETEVGLPTLRVQRKVLNYLVS